MRKRRLLHNGLEAVVGLAEIWQVCAFSMPIVQQRPTEPQSQNQLTIIFMKQKLLLTIVALLCAVGTWAQPTASSLATGNFYLYNVGAGKYIGMGGAYGTAGTLSTSDAVLFTTQEVTAGSVYKLITNVVASGRGVFFNASNIFYVDNSTPIEFTFVKQGDDNIYKLYNGDKYAKWDGTNDVIIGGAADGSGDNDKWMLVTRDNALSYLRTQMASATTSSPVDASLLLQSPIIHYGYKDIAQAAWSGSPGFNHSQGPSHGTGAIESYNNNSDVYQTVTTPPAGQYTVKCLGFSRAGNWTDTYPWAHKESTNGSLYATSGETTVTDALPSIFEGAQDAKKDNQDHYVTNDDFNKYVPDDLDGAALYFRSGYYKNWAEATLIVGTGDDLRVGFRNNGSPNGSQWEWNCVNQFKLLYHGAASSTNPIDVTSLISNPSFESNDFTGWANSGMGTQSNTALVGKSGTYYAEVWMPDGEKSVSQTLTDMPAGVYRLTARCKARSVTSAKIYAGSVERALPIADVEDDYSVEFACEAGADVTIGFVAVGTKADASWIAIDNFRLALIGESLPDVQAVSGQMNATIASTQSSAIAAYATSRTVANYNAASAAITAAKASVADYVIGKAAIDKADDILSKTNVYTSAAYTTFTTALEAARSAYNNGTWVDGEGAAYSNSVFGTGWRATATIDDFLISAWDVEPRTWANYHVNTWSTKDDSGNPHLVVPSVEYWADDNTSLSNKDMTATVAVEANKMYAVSAHITMAKNTTDYGSDASTAPVGVSLQVGSGSATTCTGSRIEETRFFEGFFEATGRADNEGNLTIKISTSGSNASWILFRDVKYTKLTEVTMKTFAPATYGTFIAPFDVAIPSGVTASKVIGLDGNRLILDDVSTTILQNTPVVVYSDAVIDETFYGKDGSDGKTSYTVDLLTGVYTNETVAAGNYVLQTQGGVQGFYEVVGDGLKAVPYRAYLNSDTSSKAFKAFFFGNDADGINIIQDSKIKDLESEVYNLAGQRLSKAQKGVNIINGKKVLIK